MKIALPVLMFASTLMAMPIMAAEILHCSGDEKKALHQAPGGAQRLNPHTLQINWLHGKKQFKDKAPHDEELSGVHWRYCGYTAKARLHLIKVQDGSLFSGVLLDENSGKTIPAGKTVQISPDGSQWFASRQPNGLDGEEWLLASRKGIIRWQGTSNLPAQQDLIEATMEKPYWSSDGKLHATHRCLANREQATRVTLTQSGKTWQWLPLISCPPAGR